MKTCKIKDCKDRHYARGWCNKHYQRWRRHGNPNVNKRKHHGYYKHFLYPVWQNMKARCYNENHIGYKDYGGRGIIVCAEWTNNFRKFIEWALPLWSEDLQIDRKDNDGDYCPKNCHFITNEENQLNKRLLQSNNTSGYKGVSYKKNSKKWIVQIMINNKNKYLGLFNSAKEAALVYNNAITDNRPRNLI